MNVCIQRTAVIAHSGIPISFLANDIVTVETNAIFVISYDCWKAQKGHPLCIQDYKKLAEEEREKVSDMESERQCKERSLI